MFWILLALIVVALGAALAIYFATRARKVQPPSQQSGDTMSIDVLAAGVADPTNRTDEDPR